MARPALVSPTGLRRPAARRRPYSRAESGSSTPEHVIALGVCLAFFVLLVQFVVWQYGRGAVRAALDEGARVGAPVAAGPSDCEDRARGVLADLLGGSMGREISVSCAQTGTEVVAEATVTFRAWMPPSPDWSFHLAAAARKERMP
ncbi:MAG: hypothetical protein ACRD0Q_08110 [Acidimicrobiales bacterium]